MRGAFSALICCVLCSLLVACSGSKPVNLAATGELHVVSQPAPLVEMPVPAVVRESDVIEITGVVRRKPGVDGPVPGHVDLVFVDSRGQTLAKLRLNWVPRQIPASGAREAAYSVRYGWLPPAGSTLQVAYHEGPDFSPPGTSSKANVSVGRALYNQPGAPLFNIGPEAARPVSVRAVPAMPAGAMAPGSGYRFYGR